MCLYTHILGHAKIASSTLARDIQFYWLSIKLTYLIGCSYFLIRLSIGAVFQSFWTRRARLWLFGVNFCCYVNNDRYHSSWVCSKSFNNLIQRPSIWILLATCNDECVSIAPAKGLAYRRVPDPWGHAIGTVGMSSYDRLWGSFIWVNMPLCTNDKYAPS